MAIASLAAALATGLVSPTLTPPLDLTCLSLDHSEHVLSRSEAFDVVFPDGVEPFPVNPLGCIYQGTPNCLITYNSDTIRVYSSLDHLKLAYQVKTTPSVFTTHVILQLQYVEYQGQSYIMILLSSKQLRLLDFTTGSLLTILDLPFNYARLQQIGSSNLFALYNASTYFTIVSLGCNGELVLSNVKYLSFTPVTTIQLPNDHLCIIEKRGNYVTLQYNRDLQMLIEITDMLLMSTFQGGLFGDPAYGNIVRFEALKGSSSSWVLIQELGWVVYQFDAMSITELISSPLVSSYESLVQLDSAFYVLMTNGMVMVVGEGNVQLVSPEVSELDTSKRTPFSIFTYNNTLWGVFSDYSDCFLCPFDSKTLTWTYFVPFSCPRDSTRSITISDAEFTLVCKAGKATLHNADSKLCSFNIAHGYVRKLIDLRSAVLGPACYLLALHDDLSMILLEFTNDYTVSGRTFPIKMPVSSVFYYEEIHTLEFVCSKQSLLLDVRTLSVLDTPLKDPKGLSKIIIFHAKESEKQQELRDVDCWNGAMHTTVVPLKEVMENSTYIAKVAKELKNQGWLGIRDHQTTITNLAAPIKSPELALLQFIATGVLVTDWKSCLDSTHFIVRLCQLAMCADYQLGESAIEFLKHLMERAVNTDMLHSLFQQSLRALNSSLSESDKLQNSLILGLIVSADHNLYTPKVSSLLMRFLVGNLLTLDERICHFTFHILLKLNGLILERFKSNPFDLVAFFKHILELRSEFSKGKSKRSFNSLKVSTEYIDSVFAQNPTVLTIVIGAILANNANSLKTKAAVVDYLNYVILETREQLDETFVLLIVNSLVAFIQEIPSHVDQELWDPLNLLFNIMGNCFSPYMTMAFGATPTGQVCLDNLLKHRHGKATVVITVGFELGYVGQLIQLEDKKWEVTLLKRPSTPMQILDGPINSSDVRSKVRSILGKHNSRYLSPALSQNCHQLAIIDTSTLEILVWDLLEAPAVDTLDVEILKDDSIPLKVPSFNLIALQAIWARSELTHCFAGADLTAVVSQFPTPACRPEALIPLGKLCFGEILLNYSQVFTDVTYDDLALVWDAPARLVLHLRDKPVFVYNL